MYLKNNFSDINKFIAHNNTEYIASSSMFMKFVVLLLCNCVYIADYVQIRN